jgi:hypothetical protein
MPIIVINVQMTDIIIKRLELMQSRFPRQLWHVQFFSTIIRLLSHRRLWNPMKIKPQIGKLPNPLLAQFALLSANVQFSLCVEPQHPFVEFERFVGVLRVSLVTFGVVFLGYRQGYVEVAVGLVKRNLVNTQKGTALSPHSPSDD